MFKKIINTAVLVSAICVAGCSNDKAVAIPAGVLSKEAFTKVLVDFALAESAANMNIKSAPVFKIDSVYAFDPLKENKVTKVQYDSTLAFYTRHTDLYQDVYQNVLTELSNMQTRRDSLKTHATATNVTSSITSHKFKRDSLKILPASK
jgi:hypothetical protein